MKTWQKFGTLGVLVSLSIGAWMLRDHSAGDQPAAPIKEKTSRSLEQKLSTLNQQHMDDLKSTLQKAEAKSDSVDSKAVFNEALPKIWKMHLSVGKKEFYSETAKQIKNKQQVIDDLVHVVTDINATRERFGDMQAQARIAAIDLLTELAAQGQPNDLIRAHKDLLSKKVTNEGYEENQEQDRFDMLKVLIESRKDQIMKDLPGFLREVGFDPKLAQEYDDLIWVKLKYDQDNDELKQVLKYFDVYEKKRDA